MEAQAQYWMWMKRQRDQILKSFSDDSAASWEEKAFAEDAAAAARSVGGSTWPPRSYSCGFCRRDFKSAQALGGHMNVHRRDRARLKNSLKLSTTNPKYPSDNSSSPSNNNVVVVAASSSSPPPPPPLSNSRVSATSSTVQRNSSSSSSFVQAKQIVIKDYYYVDVETKLSVGLKPNICCDDEAITSCSKRTKTRAATSALPFFISNENFGLENENLDLELRLGGDPPKVL